MSNPILDGDAEPKRLIKRVVLDALRWIAKQVARAVIVFAIGTAVGAALCLGYGVSLKFSILGGLLALGAALGMVLLLS